MSSVSVIGCGYVGLVTAVGLASLGHQVTGVDKDLLLLAELSAGETRLMEPRLPALLRSQLAADRLSFTASYESVATADFVILAVDTPATPAGAANLSSIRSAVRSVAAVVDGHCPIIVNKSTSPIGTGDTIDLLLRQELREKGHRPRIVSNPEFLREGSAVDDFAHPDRIVIGGEPEDVKAVAGLYRKLGGDRLYTDVRTAEMIKYASNAYLATRVSYINEIANLCGGLSIPVDDVIAGLRLDPRIGPAFLSPGIGYGGSCLPKDVAALRYTGEAYGVSTPLLAAVEVVNRGQRVSVVRRLRAALGPLDDRRIAVWGITFKPGVRDARISPAVDIVHMLLNEGADVSVHDPSAPDHVPEEIAQRYCATPLEAVTGADALVILTGWPDYREVAVDDVAELMRGDIVFDGVNLLAPDTVRATGLQYTGVGR